MRSSPNSPSLVQILILLLGAVACAFLTFGSVGGQFGNIDFIEYWTANVVLHSEANPYIPENMASAQHALGRVGEPMMMWNPPWLLLLLQPILNNSYGNALNYWLVVNSVLVVSMLFFALASYRPRLKVGLAFCLCGLFFPPFWECLIHGQVSILLAFAICNGFLLLRAKHPFAAGVLFSLISLKPTLFILFCVFLLWWAIRSWQMQIFAGLFLGLGAMMIGTDALWHGSISRWAYAMYNQTEIGGLTRIDQGIGATFPSFLRASVPGLHAFPATGVFVSLLASVATLSWCISRREKLNLEKMFPMILIFSVFSAPFGSFFDHSVLFVVAIVGALSLHFNSGKFCSALLVISPLVFLFRQNAVNVQHEMVWFPLVLLMGYLLSRKKLLESEAEPPPLKA